MRCARCSTSRTVTPRSRIAASAAKTASTMRRREPERRLVEEEHIRLGDERPPDRELLLLAARERAGLPGAELGQHREEFVGRAAAGRPRPFPPRGEPEPQVLLDRELAEDPAAFRHERDAGPRDRLRRAAAQRSPVEPDVAALAAGTTPMIACRVVDLPAPFGPIRPTSSPAPTSRLSPRTAGTRAVADVEPVELEHGVELIPPPRSRPGRRTRRRGWPRISAGVPSASVRPWSSTWIRSQTSITSAMLWSIRSTPASWSSRTPRITAANSRHLRLREPRRPARPGARSAGSVASARATPSRRSSPCASSPAGASAKSSPSSVEQPVRAPACIPRPRADPERRDLDVLAHGQARGTSGCAERSDAIPARPRRCGLQPVTSRSLELDACPRSARRSR